MQIHTEYMNIKINLRNIKYSEDSYSNIFDTKCYTTSYNETIHLHILHFRKHSENWNSNKVELCKFALSFTLCRRKNKHFTNIKKHSCVNFNNKYLSKYWWKSQFLQKDSIGYKIINSRTQYTVFMRLTLIIFRSNIQYFFKNIKKYF